MTAQRKRLGMITPSSNSVLEPVTCAMMANVTSITAHFSRFRVTEIALDAAALDQFDASVMLPAADLLARREGRRDRLERDLGELARRRPRQQAFARRSAARTGTPATTSTLACIDAVAALGATRIGIVSPYTATSRHASRRSGPRLELSRRSGTSSRLAGQFLVRRGIARDYRFDDPDRGGRRDATRSWCCAPTLTVPRLPVRLNPSSASQCSILSQSRCGGPWRSPAQITEALRTGAASFASPRP